MAKKSKPLKKNNLTASRREWIEKYQTHTTFEVFGLEDFQAGEYTWEEFKKKNLDWLREWSMDVLRELEE